MANKRQAKKATATRRTPPEPEDIKIEVEATPVIAEETPRRKIRVITNPPENNTPQTTMGRAIRPFARPAQSGAFAPFAVEQARRGH